MSKARKFFYNTLIMTITTVLMRSISVVFNIYISKKAGFASIGLIELIMSVYSFAIIVAASGVSLAATRLVSEEIAKKSESGIKNAMSHCIVYSLICGIGACILLLLTANFIGTHMLNDKRTIKALYILSLSLPLISVQSAFFGYFNAVRRVLKSAVSQIVDQIVRICLIVIALKIFIPMGLEYVCIGVGLSSTLTELCSFLLLVALYKSDMKRYKDIGLKPKNMTKRMLRISVPIALSTYAGSALSSIKHIMIPLGLVKYGMTKEMALSSFGWIRGMVFGIMM